LGNAGITQQVAMKNTGEKLGRKQVKNGREKPNKGGETQTPTDDGGIFA
jgi:hypothetical protein